jgi:hypothetical protein
MFFKTLEVTLTYKIHPTRIQNVDESSLLAVQKQQKLFTVKRKTLVGSITSAERRQPVAVVCCTSSIRSFIAPALLYARTDGNISCWLEHQQ